MGWSGFTVQDWYGFTDQEWSGFGVSGDGWTRFWPRTPRFRGR